MQALSEVCTIRAAARRPVDLFGILSLRAPIPLCYNVIVTVGAQRFTHEAIWRVRIHLPARGTAAYNNRPIPKGEANMEQVTAFPSRVTLYDDGAYRWTYDTRAHHNSSQYETMVGICLAVFLPIAIIMLVMTWQYGAAQALLFTLGLLALGVGLPALIWKLSPVNPSYCMSETEIEAWPKGRSRHLHAFEGLRGVRMHSERDLIRLRWAAAGMDVYVPTEDFRLVADFIIAHAPAGVEIRW